MLDLQQPAPPVEWIPVFDDRREIIGYLDGRLADRGCRFFSLRVADRAGLAALDTIASPAVVGTFVHEIVFAWHRICSRRAVAPMHVVDCLAVNWDKAYLLQNLTGFVYFAEHHGKKVAP